MKVWILTSEYNEYDQYGEYFDKVFSEKPNEEQLVKAGVPSVTVDHVLKGGGRESTEDKWWHLREHDC